MSKLQKIILLWVLGTILSVYFVKIIGHDELSIVVILGSIGAASYLLYQKGKTVVGSQNGKAIYSNEFICTECGNVGKASLKLGGSAWAEVVAWMISIALIMVTFGLSLLIGIAYTASRRSNETKVCKDCKGKVIAVNSPEGQALMSKYGLMG